MIINKKSNDHGYFSCNKAIVNSTIASTQHQDRDYPNTVKSNIKTYIENNVNTSGNISQKSSTEFTIQVWPSNRITELFIPSDTHTPLVASAINVNSRLTLKSILKIEAHALVLTSYIECELSALTSKIEVFSDSIRNVLSDLQNKKHKNGQVLKKNITFLQNKIKPKDTTIESLLETQKAPTKPLSDQIPKPF